MGLFTWIIVVVVILAIIGLGWQTFFSGVTQGAEKVASSPIVRNVTNEAEEFVANATESAAREIVERMI